MGWDLWDMSLSYLVYSGLLSGPHILHTYNAIGIMLLSKTLQKILEFILWKIILTA